MNSPKAQGWRSLVGSPDELPVSEKSNLQIVVVAGPNGAGKSTLAELLVPRQFGILDYVNADTIAKGLSAFGRG
jgi:hypothetical protein